MICFVTHVLVLLGSCSPTVPEPELYRSIQAILPKETDSPQTLNCYNKGANANMFLNLLLVVFSTLTTHLLTLG